MGEGGGSTATAFLVASLVYSGSYFTRRETHFVSIKFQVQFLNFKVIEPKFSYYTVVPLWYCIYGFVVSWRVHVCDMPSVKLKPVVLNCVYF